MLVLLILLLVYTTSAYGCGTSTHINIAHQAARTFKTSEDFHVNYAELVRKHQDAFVAGNPYPDAMYPSLCFDGKYHDVAEDTHWTEFLNASIHYVREKYPQPWDNEKGTSQDVDVKDQETEKLVVFIFGLVSHQVADITWHSLGIEQGFIRTMSAMNFHNVYDPAHTTADVGGDMLTQYDDDDQPIGLDSWYVPVDDLYNIYKEFYVGNLTVPKAVLEGCTSLLYIEYFAEKYGGAEIFEMFAKKSPFLLKHLNDYFIGGIHDMASWTTLIWNHTAYMFEHGTQNCSLNHNPLFIQCNQVPLKELGRKTAKNPGRAYPLLTGHWNTTDVRKTRTNRGVYLYPGTAMKLHRMKKQQQQQQQQQQSARADDTRFNKQTYNQGYEYSSFGRSMTSIRIQNKTKLAIGAPNYGKPGLPQLGRVFITSPEKMLFDYDSLEASDDVIILEGQSLMGKFGWDLSTVDYNNDGFDDLVVSAPVQGADLLQYYGRVYIYLASQHGLSKSPQITLRYPNETQYTNYGTVLKACNQHLFIATPYHAEQKGLLVDATLASPHHRGIGVTGSIMASDCVAWEMFGIGNYSWFGYALDCTKTEHDNHVLVVGSPGFRKCFFTNCTYDKRDMQAVGKVDVFVNKKLFTSLYGDVSFSEFGSSIAIGRPFQNGDIVLAVSSPARDVSGSLLSEIPIEFHQAGQVLLYNLTHLLTHSNNPQNSLIARYQGDRAYGRFGDTVKFADLDGDGIDELIISQPRRTHDISEEFYGREQGAVYVFNSSTMKGDPTTKECGLFQTVPCPEEVAKRTFKGSEVNARFGSSIEILNFEDGRKKIAVSVPRSSKNGFRSGTVKLFDL